MTKNILLAAAVAVALLGCASMEDQKARRIPNTDAKNPQVYVLSDGAQSCADRVLAIVVEPPTLHFSDSGKGNGFHIVWQMRTKGYRFAQNPKLPDPAPIQGSAKAVITECSSNGATMQCRNLDTAKGDWKYDIKGVIADDGCNPPDLDPLISND